jgi:hypothetical protein
MAVKVRCCRYGIGAYWLGTAVQVRTGKVLYWPGKFRLGRKCAEDWTGVSGTERWGLAVADRFV